MNRKIGAYEVLAELGRGGMGIVYRVRHIPTGVERALKVLPAGSHAIAAERFKREVDALARLGQSGVVAIHDAGTFSGRTYFAMDLMPGGSLRARLDEKGAAPWREAVGIGVAIARTLEKSHALGLVHRDLKPENVLFDEQGAPRLCDFGCVKDLGAASLTKTGAPIGTLHYMSPEQMNGRPTDARSDIFALAILVHELVAGTHPWAESMSLANLLAVDSSERPRLAVKDGPPPELDLVLDRALATDPDRRTPSATVFREQLAAILEGKPVVLPGRSRRTLRVLLLVALALGAAVLYLAVARTPDVPGPAAPPRVVEPPAPADPLVAAAEDEARARAAHAAGRFAESLAASERALAVLAPVDPSRARALRVLRARSLAALGRSRELVGAARSPEEQADELRIAADALTDEERWPELLALPGRDPVVAVRQAWARHRTHPDLDLLVSVLARIHDLEPPAAAALEGLRARQHLVRKLASSENPPELRSEMRDALLAMAKAAPAADPRLLDRAWDLRLLEGLFFDRPRFGLDVTPAVMDAIHAAAHAVAPDASLPEVVAIDTLMACLADREDAPDEHRAVVQSLRPRAGIAARYALARAVVLADDAVAKALATGEAADLETLVQDMKRLAPLQPAPDDERLGLTADSIAERHPHPVAALAATILASRGSAAAAAASTRWLAVAREELAAGEKGARDGALEAELALLRFLIAVASGDRAAADLSREPSAGAGCEAIFMRGEERRLAGDLVEARVQLFAASVRAPLCSTRFFLEVVGRDVVHSRFLAGFDDPSVTAVDRASIRTELSGLKPAFLGWIRKATERAVAGR